MRPSGPPASKPLPQPRRSSQSCSRGPRHPEKNLKAAFDTALDTSASLNATSETAESDLPAQDTSKSFLSTNSGRRPIPKPPKQKAGLQTTPKPLQKQKLLNLETPNYMNTSTQSVQTAKHVFTGSQHLPTSSNLAKTPGKGASKAAVDLRTFPAPFDPSAGKRPKPLKHCSSSDDHQERAAPDPANTTLASGKKQALKQPLNLTLMPQSSKLTFKRKGIADVIKISEPQAPAKPSADLLPQAKPPGAPQAHRLEKRPTAKHSKKNSISGLNCTTLRAGSPIDRKDRQPTRLHNAPVLQDSPLKQPSPHCQEAPKPAPAVFRHPPRLAAQHPETAGEDLSPLGHANLRLRLSPSKARARSRAGRASQFNRSFHAPKTVEVEANPNDLSCGCFQTDERLLGEEPEGPVSVERLLPAESAEEAPEPAADLDPSAKRRAEELFEQIRAKNFLAADLSQKTRAQFGGPVPPKEFKTTISYYTLDKLLATGTFGQVYLGRQVLTGEKVAIKVFPKHLAASASGCREAIENELAVLRRISSAHGSCDRSVRFLEEFEVHHSRFIVSEFASKGNLLQWAQRLKSLSEEVLRPLFQNILLGVKQVHALGVVHRDLKPENILIDKHERAKIADFGLAQHTGLNRRLSDLCGSPAYQAPETFAHQEYDGFEADVWSLGVVFYQTVYGEVPFVADKVEDMPEKLRKKKLAFPANPEASNKLKDLLNRMLQKEPERRVSLDQALNHVWFEGAAGPGEEPAPDADPQKQQFARHFVSSVGFPEKYLADSLKENKHNHATACYKTLMARDF